MGKNKKEEQKTCINKNLHIHHVADTLFMKNQYSLQNNYFRCIDLPNKNNNNLSKFSFYTNIAPPIIVIRKKKNI